MGFKTELIVALGLKLLKMKYGKEKSMKNLKD